MDLPTVRLHTGAALPARLVANVAGWPREELSPGWLDGLPGAVAALCARWAITLDPVIPESAITLVLLGRSETLGPVAIKSSPLADEFLSEATALRLAEGDSVARLYDLDLARSAMVIERIVPGTQLRQVAMDDDDATRLAAELAVSFQRPVADPAGLHPLRRWMRALFAQPAGDGPIAPELIVHAQHVAAELLERSNPARLLHGDLQHHNLLRRETGAWAIIDPKGVYGAPGFEFAAWMYNPPGVMARDDYLALAERRIAIWSGVSGIREEELAAWAYAGAVLSICWAARDPASAQWVRQLERGARLLRTLLDPAAG